MNKPSSQSFNPDMILKNESGWPDSMKPSIKGGMFQLQQLLLQLQLYAAADAAVTASHVDVNDDEGTDYGGCYSNQSSHSYEGVVAPNSPPTPEVKKKKKTPPGQ